jgi:hypothetical protein
LEPIQDKDEVYEELSLGECRRIAEYWIKGFNVNVGVIMKPCFDAIWNACGISKSPNYNENGVWVPPP